MARTFVAATQDEIDLRIAEGIKAREMELAAYDFERKSHEAAIAALGDLKWDETTAEYRGMPRDEMAARALADGLTSEQIQAISDLNALEAHRVNLEAVKIETKRAEQHYESALTSLPAGARRDAAITKLREAETTTPTR